MESVGEREHLLALAQLGASATQPGPLVDKTLPQLRELTGADAAVVVSRSADGPVVAATDGLVLPIDGLALPEERLGLVPVDLPDSWTGAGVQKALAHLLPGHAGVLVLAWTAAEVASDEIETAVGVLDSALARLDAEEKLADLVLRVDSAQHLAGMGDYDWHIATDTNRWSDQLYRIYGYEPQSFNALVRTLPGNIHPEDRERSRRSTSGPTPPASRTR